MQDDQPRDDSAPRFLVPKRALHLRAGPAGLRQDTGHDRHTSSSTDVDDRPVDRHGVALRDLPVPSRHRLDAVVHPVEREQRLPREVDRHRHARTSE